MSGTNPYTSIDGFARIFETEEPRIDPQSLAAVARSMGHCMLKAAESQRIIEDNISANRLGGRALHYHTHRRDYAMAQVEGMSSALNSVLHLRHGEWRDTVIDWMRAQDYPLAIYGETNQSAFKFMLDQEEATKTEPAVT